MLLEKSCNLAINNIAHTDRLVSYNQNDVLSLRIAPNFTLRFILMFLNPPV